jgi:hypothetical protein
MAIQQHTVRSCILNVSAICALTAHAAADVYHVGPAQQYANFQALPDLVAGDLVLVDGGGAIYPGNIDFFDEGHGTAEQPIILRGVIINNQRPRIMGGVNCIRLDNDYYTLENFEISGGASRGIYTAGHGNVIRNCIVHDCPNHGILGGDGGSGDLLIEYTEVHHCGSGTQNHQIYVASDNDEHPAATFRMQFCYVHHANGGSNVKSRCGRNEIYYNWIEGAAFHELECIGADPAGQSTPPETVREDSDIVGNVLMKTSGSGLICRVGGDGTGASDGRYRFVNNTCILFDGTQAVFRYQDLMESMECHNNVFFQIAGGSVRIYSDILSEPLSSVAFSGTNNWIPTGSTFVPAQWTNTIEGAAPGIANGMRFDFTPTPDGALLDAGNIAPSGPIGFRFPNPLFPPEFLPPQQSLIAVGSAQSRWDDGTIDIGGFEFWSPCAGDIVSSATFQPPPDGQVDAADLAFLLGDWGANPGSPADIVNSATFQPPPDGLVDGADLAVLLGAWGRCD